jgi:hypothetical protein
MIAIRRVNILHCEFKKAITYAEAWKVAVGS